MGLKATSYLVGAMGEKESEQPSRSAPSAKLTRTTSLVRGLRFYPQVRKHCMALLHVALTRISKSRAGTADDRVARIDACADEYADMARALGSHALWVRTCTAAKKKQQSQSTAAASRGHRSLRRR
jgi:hypothetical protein